jgi:hypothetical protein
MTPDATGVIYPRSRDCSKTSDGYPEFNLSISQWMLDHWSTSV